MSGKIVEDQWNVFVESVSPTLDKNSVQFRDMKRIFFAGVTVAMTVTSHVSATMPEEQAVEILERIWDELNAFAGNLIETERTRN